MTDNNPPSSEILPAAEGLALEPEVTAHVADAVPTAEGEAPLESAEVNPIEFLAPPAASTEEPQTGTAEAGTPLEEPSGVFPQAEQPTEPLAEHETLQEQPLIEEPSGEQKPQEVVAPAGATGDQPEEGAAGAADATLPEAPVAPVQSAYVKEGVLFKPGKIFSFCLKQRDFRLTSDGRLQWSRNSWQNYKEFRLSTSTRIEKRDKPEGKAHPHMIELFEEKNKFTMMADSQEERDQWYDAISQVIASMATAAAAMPAPEAAVQTQPQEPEIPQQVPTQSAEESQKQPVPSEGEVAK